MENWIYRRIKSVAIARGLAWNLALAGFIGIIYLGHNYAYNFFVGPFPTSSEQIESIDNIGNFHRDFVTLDATNAIDTGLKEVVTNTAMGIKIGESESHYYLIPVGSSRLLIIKSGKEPGTRVTGQLTSTRLGSEGDLQERIGGEHPDRIYPFYLDTDSYRLGGYVYGVTLLIFMNFFWRAMLRMRQYIEHPESHPVAMRLASWADGGAITQQIKQTAKSPVLKSKGWKITETLVIRSTVFNFNVFRLSDMVWAYKHVTRHSTNFIPTGKTYALIMNWPDESATVEGDEKTVDKILQFGSKIAPWAVYGYSDELKKTFDERKVQFCEAVAKRRQEQQ